MLDTLPAPTTLEEAHARIRGLMKAYDVTPTRFMGRSYREYQLMIAHSGAPTAREVRLGITERAALTTEEEAELLRYMQDTLRELQGEAQKIEAKREEAEFLETCTDEEFEQRYADELAELDRDMELLAMTPEERQQREEAEAEHEMRVGAYLRDKRARAEADRRFEAEQREVGDAEPFQIVTRAELRSRPRPAWLVEGLLQGDGVIVLAAEPGLGKTFLCLDFAAHIATGRDWHGHATRGGRTLYVAAEGIGFFDDRLSAWEQFNGEDVDDAMLEYVESGFELTDPRAVEHMKALVAERAYDLVVLDTLSQLARVENENDAAQLAAAIRAAQSIREARPGTSVLVVHHTNKGDSPKLRGSSAIRSNVDTVIVGRKAGSGFTLSTRSSWDGKMKNAAPVHLEGFSLVSYGPSAVVMREEPLTPTEKAVLRVLEAAEGEAVAMADFLGELGEDSDAARKSVQRVLGDMKAAGLVEMKGAKRGTRYRAVQTQEDAD